MNKKWTVNLALLALAAVIAVLPLFIVKDSEFAGADAVAKETIEAEGFKPWFSPIWEPPGTETESFLFAFQAALGSGVIFYCLGYWKGRRDNTK